MSQVSVNILLAAVPPEQMTRIVRRMEKLGFSVDQLMEDIGVVTGAIEAEHVAELQALDGVDVVELARDIQLPPPDNKVQ